MYYFSVDKATDPVGYSSDPHKNGSNATEHKVNGLKYIVTNFLNGVIKYLDHFNY